MIYGAPPRGMPWRAGPTRSGIRQALPVGVAVVVLFGTVIGLGARAIPAGAAVPTPHAAPLATTLVWQQSLPDAGQPIAQSSPSDGHPGRRWPLGGRGRPGRQPWAFHLVRRIGARRGGRPTPAGRPIDSTPSVHTGRHRHRQRCSWAPATPPSPGSAATIAFNHAVPSSGGATPPTPTASYGVQASMSVGLAQRRERGGGPVPRPGGVRPQRRQRGASSRAGRSSPPTAASPPRRWPTSTATGRPRSSRAATRRRAWPTA